MTPHDPSQDHAELRTPDDQNGQNGEVSGEIVDEGVPAELVNDKMIGESVLRRNADANDLNPNDQPGFDDGRLGGSDGEDRQGDPNMLTGSDLGGEAHGGSGRERSGGVDGGPARKKPLPGQE